MAEELGLDLGGENASPSEESVVEEITLGNQFLSKIPEQDRPIVEKYVRDWDGNVTKKLQSVHEQYKPYKDLGELEQLRRAQAFTQNFQQNGPQMFGKMLKGFFEHYGDDAYQELNKLLGIEGAQQAMSDAGMDPNWDLGQEEEPDEDSVWRQNIQAELEELREFRSTYQEQVALEAAGKELDKLLEQVAQSRPDVPQQYITQGIAAGETNIQNIIQSWDVLKEQFAGKQQTSRPNPPITGGQGGVPANGQVDVSKLDKNGRMTLVEQMLAASQD